MGETEVELQEINPLDHVRPYFSQLTDNEISILIGSIILFQDVKLKLVQDILNLTRLEIEEQIGRLLQSNLIQGQFTSDSFKLTTINYSFEKQDPNLTLDDRVFLSYVKARFRLSIRELEKAFNLTFEAVVHIISTFVTQGLISTHRVSEKYFEFVVNFELEKRPVEEITNQEKEIIGYAILREATSFHEISDNLEIPEHRVQAIIVDMILSNMILCSFHIKKSKIKTNEVVVMIKHFQVLFVQRPVEIMTETEKLIIGYLHLRKSASLREISTALNVHRSSILSTVSRLTATREMPFNLSGKGFLKPLKEYKASRVIPIDQLVASSLFNYRVLLGLLSTEVKLDLKTIQRKMSVKRFEALKGIIDLYISGHVIGEMKSAENIEILDIAKTTSIRSIALEDWERIILGALMFEQVISWPKIAALLAIDRETARERAYSFISRGIASAIARDTVLTLSELPKLPPLIQVTDLSTIDQQILGYILLRERVSLKVIRNRFGLSQIEAYSRVYLLMGSGVLVVENSKKSLNIVERRQPTPNVPINELEYGLQKTVQLIESARFDNKMIQINDLLSGSNFSTKEFLDNLSVLIARGYYDGKYDGKYFMKTKKLFRIRAKPQCFDCNTIISEITQPCPNCNAILPLCTVCKGPILTSDFIVACPFCKHESHSTHIQEWLKIKGECPVCKNSLNSLQLININY